MWSVATEPGVRSIDGKQGNQGKQDTPATRSDQGGNQTE